MTNPHSSIPFHSLMKLSLENPTAESLAKIKFDLCEAISAGDNLLVDEILKEKKRREQCIDALFANKHTPLMWAVVQCRNSIAKLLLDHHANPSVGCKAQDLGISRNSKRSIFSRSGFTHYSNTDEIIYPLQIAADAKNVPLVEMLLQHGAKPDHEYEGGIKRLLYFGVKMNALDLVERLARQAKENDMCQVSHIDFSEHLMAAVHEGHLKMAKLLMDLGANPNREQSGVLPLVVAANKKDMRMCLTLINGGSNLNSNYTHTLGMSQTPLGMAVNAGWEAAVTTLLYLGSDVNARTEWTFGGTNSDFYLRPGSPMLHFAVYKRNVPIAKQLLGCGADLNGTDFELNTALHLACEDKSGFTDMVRFLLQSDHRSNNSKHGPSIEIDKQNKLGMTPLMIAAKNGTPELVDLLLQHDANPNMKASNKDLANKSTALHFAVSADREAVVLSLLRSGALVDGMCTKLTPLHLAIKLDNSHLANILLENGANPSILTGTRESCIHLAIGAKSMDLVGLLLRRGLSVNMCSNTGETVLMLSARQDCTDICKLLIHHGALLNVRDRNKETALSLSVYFGFEENALVLIAEGADMNIGDKKQTTPVYWCMYNNRIATLKRLILAGANFTQHQFCSYPRNLSIMRNQQLMQWIQQWFIQVPSLQHLTRLAFRAWLVKKARGSGIGMLVGRLPVPKKIKNYLMLESPDFESCGLGN